MNPEVENEINEILEDCADKYFPKGDKRRGEALVLMAKAHIEIEKARQQGEKDGFDRAVKEFWDKLKANKILENETIVHKVEEIETEAYYRGKKDGIEAERKRINEIIKSVIYEKFEEDGFYKYYSDKVIQSILSQLKNSEAIKG